MGIKQIQSTNSIQYFDTNSHRFFQSKKESTSRKIFECKYKILKQLAETQESGILVLTNMLKEILKIAASIFNTDRMSYWTLNNKHSKLLCITLYEIHKSQYSRGLCLNSNDCPNFFQNLLADKSIMSVIAQKDKCLADLKENYLIPNNIKSIYFIPVIYGSKIKGFLCCEQTIAVKYWNNEEQKYLKSLSQFIALTKTIWESNNFRKSLIENKYNLQAILDNNDSSIWFVDSSYKLLDFNKNFEIKVNKTNSKKIKRNSNSLNYFSSNDKKKWENRYSHSLEGNSAIYYDRVLHKNKWKTFEVRTTPLKSKNKVEAIYILEKEITQKESAANKIKKIEEKNKLILQSIPDFVIECDKNGKIFGVHANKNSNNPFKESKKELINKNISDIINKTIADNLQSKIDTIIFKKKKSVSLEFLLLDTKDLLTKEFEARLIKSNEEKVFIYFRDITEIKRNEKKLEEQNKQLIKLNKELDKFVYCASHDLRAPLSTILGLLNISKKENSQNNYLDLMEQSIRRLDLVVKDILNISKNSRMKIQREYIQIRRVIENCFENFSYLEKTEQIKLIINSNTTEFFYSDSYRVEVLLNNLISNAIKFSNSKSPIVIINVWTDSNYAKIEVTDNGFGIKKDYITNIYEMFFKGNDVYPGSGLGLYICKEILDTLNGTIKVKSSDFTGTTFYIKIPNLV